MHFNYKILQKGYFNIILRHKKSLSKNRKTLNIVKSKKLLSEFFVFVHELINSTCSINQFSFTCVERVRS